MKYTHFLNLIAIVIILSACGSEGDSKAPKDNLPIEETESTSEKAPINEMADFKFHTMIANLPSPLQMFQTISSVEIEANGVELTPTNLASNLSTTSAKAYGYGVFMTDMGFMAYRNQNQQTLDYLQACRNLAGELGAGEVFDRTVSADFEENTSNQDQFIKMMDEAFNAMDDYMVDNERFVNATEIFVGSWVESQIIATEVMRGKPINDNNKPLYDGIYAQKQHASNLMNVLGEIDTEIAKEVFTAVEDLMMFYAGFSSPESISDEDLNELNTKLKTLKNLLVT